MGDGSVEVSAGGSSMAVTSGGVELPVSLGSIEFARSTEWGGYSLGSTFNGVFYAALKSVGVGIEEGNRAIALLMRHRVEFGLTAIQVRMAYGFEKGVIGRNHRFVPSAVDGSDWEVRLMEDRGKKGDRSGRGVGCRFDALEWERIETSALAACEGLPDQVGIAEEAVWIQCNLHQSPYFKDAPSVSAVKDWLSIMKPGNEALLRDFANLRWKMRMSPGDPAGRRKARSALDEGVSAAEEAAAEDALKVRLGMV